MDIYSPDQRVAKDIKGTAKKVADGSVNAHFNSCYGGLATQDIIAYLMKTHDFSLDEDYSGDGRTVRQILGATMARSIEDSIK